MRIARNGSQITRKAIDPAAPSIQIRKRFYIGIDSGGTSTRSVLADETGTVLGIGLSGSANPNHYTRQQITDNLRNAIAGSLDGFDAPPAIASVFMGSSGISTEADRTNMRDILHALPEIGLACCLVVENDTVIGLSGGLAGRPGLALIAGTGSACYGINAKGESATCGGWGMIADDIGSAPWIGVRAIQAAVRAEDGRIPPTVLRKVVFEFLNMDEPRMLIHRLHNEGLERAELGRLAPLVIAAFGDGDAAAADIVNEAVAGLGELVAVTRRRLFGGSDCEMILVGGVALSGSPFQPLLIERIAADAPGVSLREPELTPVQGAVLEAMRLDGRTWDSATIANLRAGVRAI